MKFYKNPSSDYMHMVKVIITHCYISLGHYCTIIELFAQKTDDLTQKLHAFEMKFML